jgi:hypothetical protein
MNAATDKPTRKPRPKPPVSVLAEREFVGDKTVTEAMIPVIFQLDMSKAMRRGHSFKDYICPDSMEFDKGFFKVGQRFGRTLVRITHLP